LPFFGLERILVDRLHESPFQATCKTL
jgi:hypothetical protein